MRTGVIFTDKKYAERCWTHDVEDLIKLAGLERSLGTDIAANPALGFNWGTIKVWNEASRYQQKTQADAQELLDAISNSVNGMLTWIKNHW